MEMEINKKINNIVYILPIFFGVFFVFYLGAYYWQLQSLGENDEKYQKLYGEQTQMQIVNDSGLLPKVAGEETSRTAEKKVALASENYKVSDINVGGSVMVIDKNEKAPLEISNVKSESFISGKKEEVKLVISWQTNKPAISEINYGKNSNQNAQNIKEDSYGYTHGVIISGLEPRATYVYQIKCKDRWGNEFNSENFGIYTSSKPVSVFDLISNAAGEVFGWALNK